MAIELDEKNNSLYINPEKLTYLTSDGRLVTPTGEAYYWEGTLVTPGGLVITADKTVVAPASEGPWGSLFDPGKPGDLPGTGCSFA